MNPIRRHRGPIRIQSDAIEVQCESDPKPTHEFSIRPDPIRPVFTRSESDTTRKDLVVLRSDPIRIRNNTIYNTHTHTHIILGFGSDRSRISGRSTRLQSGLAHTSNVSGRLIACSCIACECSEWRPIKLSFSSCRRVSSLCTLSRSHVICFCKEKISVSSRYPHVKKAFSVCTSILECFNTVHIIENYIII